MTTVLGLFFLLLAIGLAFVAGVVCGHRFALYVRARNWWQDQRNSFRWPQE